jgi:hypothetical protein
MTNIVEHTSLPRHIAIYCRKKFYGTGQDGIWGMGERIQICLVEFFEGGGWGVLVKKNTLKRFIYRRDSKFEFLAGRVSRYVVII